MKFYPTHYFCISIKWNKKRENWTKMFRLLDRFSGNKTFWNPNNYISLPFTKYFLKVTYPVGIRTYKLLVDNSSTDTEIILVSEMYSWKLKYQSGIVYNGYCYGKSLTSSKKNCHNAEIYIHGRHLGSNRVNHLPCYYQHKINYSEFPDIFNTEDQKLLHVATYKILCCQ